MFEGGFLGLDNIGPFDRSSTLPGGGLLEQSDGTAWMAKYCLNMLEIALRLANHDATYEDVALKFFEHSRRSPPAMSELWDEQDGFFYDRVRQPDGTIRAMRSRSMVGLLPIFAAVPAPRVALGEPAQFPHARPLVHRPPAGADGVPALFRHRRPARADLPRRRAAAAARARPDARRSGVPVAVRAALAVALPPRPPARRCRWTGPSCASSTSRRSRAPGSSAATPTGAARSGFR